MLQLHRSQNKALLRPCAMIRLKEVQNSMTQEAQDHRTSLAFLVYSLVAMFIAWSSWKSSLAAYGICTCDILFLLLQFLHSNVFFFSFLNGTSVFHLQS